MNFGVQIASLVVLTPLAIIGFVGSDEFKSMASAVQSAGETIDGWADAVAIATEFIKKEETFQEVAYRDGVLPNGQPRYSWGYGTLAPGPGTTINKAEAEKELSTHLAGNLETVDSVIHADLAPHQAAALASFQYNTGALEGSGLAAEVNADNDAGIERELGKWVHWTPRPGAAKEVAPGLVNRRRNEWNLFRSGADANN